MLHIGYSTLQVRGDANQGRCQKYAVIFLLTLPRLWNLFGGTLLSGQQLLDSLCLARHFCSTQKLCCTRTKTKSEINRRTGDSWRKSYDYICFAMLSRLALSSTRVVALLRGTKRFATDKYLILRFIQINNRKLVWSKCFMDKNTV